MKRIRSVIATILVAIYAVATFGYDLSVTLCHCNHSHHVQLHHSHDCHSCHDCKHNTSGDGISSANPCNCLHDHSTDIDIYDKTRIVNRLIRPSVCSAVIPTTSSPYNLPTTFASRTYPDGDTALPDAPDRGCFGLRAPPVFA